VSVKADGDLAALRHLMLERNVRHVPVVDDDGELEAYRRGGDEWARRVGWR